MPLILVGTRYQAVMALSIIRARDIEKFHLVIFTTGPSADPLSDVAFGQLARRAASVRIVDRTMRPSAFQAELLRLAARQLLEDRTIMTAAIAVLQVMMVFRLLPPLRCITFDEGGYNVSADSPFRRMNNQSRLKKLLFPRGIVDYAHRRTAVHYTAFDPELNLFADKARQIQVDWAALLSQDDLHQLPVGSSSLFVLPCMRDLNLSDETRREILDAAAKCDFAIRHPREKDVTLPNAVTLNSPAEAVIGHLAEGKPVTVKHFRSTVGRTISNLPNVTVVDFAETQATLGSDGQQHDRSAEYT